MADISFTINAALAGVPVNKHPLVDSTTGATIQGAVAYNAAGMALRWHFVTTAGAYTVTSVTPTTAGVHDWTDPGDAGIYTLEIPASGGTINNNAAGFGWFTGSATGILPWSSWIYEFRGHANLNAALVDGTEFLEVASTKVYQEIVTGNMVAKKRDNSTTQYSVPATTAAGADVLTKIG